MELRRKIIKINNKDYIIFKTSSWSYSQCKKPQYQEVKCEENNCLNCEYLFTFIKPAKKGSQYGWYVLDGYSFHSGLASFKECKKIIRNRNDKRRMRRIRRKDAFKRTTKTV